MPYKMIWYDMKSYYLVSLYLTLKPCEDFV